MRYLLLDAGTNSEWDDCSFALVEMDDSYEQWLRSRIKLAKELKEKESINEFVVYGEVVQFFSDKEDLPEELRSQIFSGVGGNSTVKIEEDLVKKFSRPEQYIRCGEIKFSEYGFVFRADGKHTGEEFYTYIFNFD